jgi:hypothetical protein
VNETSMPTPSAQGAVTLKTQGAIPLRTTRVLD